MNPDGELLRQYLAGSEAAFTALVRRHVNLVYRTALRRVGGNAHAADDVTQRVFTALARKAVSLGERPSVAGWLYTSTRFAAAELVRGEQRRRTHEQEAHTMHQINAPTHLSAEQVDPFVDEILATLPDRDREAVLLHFFEGQTFQEIGEAIGSTSDATRMRVNRALDRLRSELGRRGIVSTGAALGTVLSTHSTAAATLPDAGLLAARALADAGLASAAAVSSAGWVAALKSLPVLAAGGIAVTAVVVGVVLRPARPSAHADAEVAIVEAVPPAEAARTSGSDSTPTTGAAPEQRTAATRMSPVGVPPAMPTFTELSPRERNLLAFLWQCQVSLPPGHRSSIGIGASAPNFAAIEPLLRRQLIKELESDRSRFRRVTLTPLGAKFCEANRTVVEAMPPVANVRRMPAGP